jgi:prophage tail gpP-like protein
MTQPMVLEINGKPCGSFTKASATISIEKLSGVFEFTATSSQNILFPINTNSKCRILINGTSVINGWVEKITVNYDTTAHDITINGRDKTCDLIDDCIGGNLVFNPPISLVDITKILLKSLNLSDIKVSSNVAIEPFSAGEIVAPELGMRGFDFIEQYARKRQVLITSDGSGNIVFTRSGNSILKTTLLSNPTQYATILSASVDVDTTKRYNRYIMVTQANPSGAGGNTFSDLSTQPEPKKETYITNEAIDQDIRPSRIKYTHMETSTIDDGTVQNRALWELNLRRCEGFKYMAVVQGFNASKDKSIWLPNKLVNIVDEYCNVKGQYLISEVVFNYDLQNGSKTTLKLVDKDSFTVKNIKGKFRDKKKKSSKQADTFSGL